MSSNVVPHPRALALADLARSGLTAVDFKRLKLAVLSSDETFTRTERYRARSLLFPYLDAAGRETDFYRLRFLDDVRGFGARKPRRYWQPAGTACRVYLAPYVDWPVVLKDPGVELYVTEGEKKAAAACKAGFPTLGLGGVWAWRSARLRQPLLPDLLAIAWKGRRVKLAFDTDAEPKPEVAGALEALGVTLERHGALVGVLTLPLLGDDAKTGLDDFLVAKGRKALETLECVALAAGAELLKLNEELAVLQSPAAILHVPTGHVYTSTQPLTEIVYAHWRVPSLDKAGRLGDVNAVREWLRWPRRRGFTGVAYEPGEPRVLGDGRYNLWAGWPVEARRGDVSLLEALLAWLTAGLTPAERRWLCQWLAYPVRHPGAKLYTAVVLWSREAGTGKTLLAQTLGRVYGDAFAVVTEAELHGAFNDWQARRQLILGEEVTGSDRRAEADRLKHLITGEMVTINQKYQATYRLRNCANFIFTSNHPDAFLLDREDRRFFVLEAGASAAPRPPDAWFTLVYDQWYRTDEAAAAIRWHLEHVDLTGFDPLGRAPVTQAREAMASASGSEADFRVRELLAAPDALLRLGDTLVARDLFTLGELIQFLDPDGRQRFGHLQLARALRRAGVPCLDVTRTSRGPVKLWAVRAPARWAQATHAERARAYDGLMADVKPGKY